MSEELKNEIISGTVEDVKFRNEQNGYTVLEIGCDDELITAVGIFSEFLSAKPLNARVIGLFTTHSADSLRWKATREICLPQRNSFIIISAQVR